MADKTTKVSYNARMTPPVQAQNILLAHFIDKWQEALKMIMLGTVDQEEINDREFVISMKIRSQSNK